jgi:hypothetical protein
MAAVWVESIRSQNYRKRSLAYIHYERHQSRLWPQYTQSVGSPGVSASLFLDVDSHAPGDDRRRGYIPEEICHHYDTKTK